MNHCKLILLLDVICRLLFMFLKGTAKEREVYHNALLQLFGRENIDSGEGDTRIIARVKPLTNQNLTGKFKDSDPTVIGQDVNLILILNHNSASKNIIINFNVSSTGYTRQTMKTVLSDTMSISLEANKGNTLIMNAFVFGVQWGTLSLFVSDPHICFIVSFIATGHSIHYQLLLTGLRGFYIWPL